MCLPLAELAQKLLSRDAVEFNSAINQTFAARAQYTGHGLKISGASNLKHAAWLFNFVDSGQAAVIEDVKWHEHSSTAEVTSYRFLCPRVFPLFSLAFKVKTQLRFHAEGTATPTPGQVHGQVARAPRKTDEVLYVTSFHDDWVAEQLIHRFGFIKFFFDYLFTPIVTWLVLFFSNIAFDVHARVASSHRHYVEPSVRKLATEHLPSDVTRNLDSGFRRGRKLAKGSGARLFDLVDTLAYFPLTAVESLAQFGFHAAGHVSPVPLPTPFVYYGHVEHAFRPMKINSASQRVEQMNHSLHPKQKQETKQPEKAEPKVNGGGRAEADNGVKPAQIQVGSNIKTAGGGGGVGGDDEGVPQAKTVDIASRINNEAEEKPAPAEEKPKDSLYDQLRKDGVVGPGAPPMQRNESEESTSDDAAQAGTNGSQPKSGSAKKSSSGKKKSKKNKGAKADDHAPPPSFKQGLEDAQGAK